MDRNEDPFPTQMITYSKNRNHCLLTGIQLLGVYLFCKINTEKNKEIIESFFTTDGLFMGFSDWTGFIDGKDSVIESDIAK